MLATAAFADDVVGYEAEGDAPAAGADSRTAALDDAFARAAGSALAELVAGDVRTAHKGELDREIVGHARLWVAKFTVTRDETNDDRRQLLVNVRVDRDKLRARLVELNIATQDVPADATATPLHTATVLLRVATPSGIHADFGAAAERDVPGVAAMTGVLRGVGIVVRKAPATGPAPRGDGDLPISDEDSAAVADAAKAERAAIVGVTVGAPVAVRGQPTSAALVTAHVRLVERGKPVGEGAAIAAARGDDAGFAIDRAIVAAATDVFPPAPAKLAAAGAFKGDDTPIAEPGVVLVRLPASTPFHMVLDEQRYLAGARGVRSATLRRLSPAGWVIGVATADSVARVAQLAKTAPATDTSAKVRVVGDVVEVELSP